MRLDTPKLYALMAEFESAPELLRAAERTTDAGYREVDGFSPIPIHGLYEALRQPPSRLPLLTFVCGLLGGSGMYALQYWTSAIDYPLNIGGRPLHSWVSFVPVTFELTVLCAALGAVVGLFAACRLPKPHHPMFNAKNFERATVDRFFLCIKARDPQFDVESTRQFMQALGAQEISEVFH